MGSHLSPTDPRPNPDFQVPLFVQIRRQPLPTTHMGRRFTTDNTPTRSTTIEITARRDRGPVLKLMAGSTQCTYTRTSMTCHSNWRTSRAWRSWVPWWTRHNVGYNWSCHNRASPFVLHAPSRLHGETLRASPHASTWPKETIIPQVRQLLHLYRERGFSAQSLETASRHVLRKFNIRWQQVQ